MSNDCSLHNVEWKFCLDAPEECAACRIVGERLYCSKPGTGSIAAIRHRDALKLRVIGNLQCRAWRHREIGRRRGEERPHYAIQKPGTDGLEPCDGAATTV